eukprot:1341463-Amorphochlora_amoeboformis.AAC.1
MYPSKSTSEQTTPAPSPPPLSPQNPFRPPTLDSAVQSLASCRGDWLRLVEKVRVQDRRSDWKTDTTGEPSQRIKTCIQARSLAGGRFWFAGHPERKRRCHRLRLHGLAASGRGDHKEGKSGEDIILYEKRRGAAGERAVRGRR